MVWLKISAIERDLENHQKLPNFAGLLWSSHLTKIWSIGTNVKRISISFISYLVMQNISIILATLTTFTTRGQTENEKNGECYVHIDRGPWPCITSRPSPWINIILRKRLFIVIHSFPKPDLDSDRSTTIKLTVIKLFDKLNFFFFLHIKYIFRFIDISFHMTRQ